ncbi:glycosyltransferase [Agromyces sp. LHK192]|uniref:glycosyltransferase n=1 Tax=Agromyces sp. LHK192 TaxID=2498704 RepID=UPI000FD8ACC0|nr:glycosyltransferase [Agromyces sp. LHK192]
MSARACTIVARNYLAQAEVLVASFTAHNPDVPFYTLVIDGNEEERVRAGVGTVVLPADLGLEPETLHSMMVMYDVMEFATALKPAMLMWLIRQGGTAVAYFDPDIQVFAPLHDVFTDAASHEILLTPHALDPIPRDDLQLNEQVIMQAGIYNLGFIAVGGGGYRFLSWWHERLKTEAIVDVANGLFTDQRWIDWVPSLFEHRISRDRGLNAAYWNLHERPIALRDGAYHAGADVLRFFHFSGFDPAKPWLLSKHMGDRPRIMLSDRPALAALCAEYGSSLMSAGHGELRGLPYRLTALPNGSRLSSEMRRIYRDIKLGRIPAQDDPPDPILESDAFVDWMLRPVLVGATATFSVAEYGLWQHRADLRAAFPDVLGIDGARYLSWVRVDPGARTVLAQLAGDVATAVTSLVAEGESAEPPARSSFGWSVVAYAASELGVGEAGRRMLTALEQSGVPSELVGVPLRNLSRQQHRPSRQVRRELAFENAVVCVNADQVQQLDAVMGFADLRGWRTGLWFWELEEFPDHFRGAFAPFDEIWVASRFTQKAVQSKTEKPVRLIPLPMDLPTEPTRFTRRSVGLPEDKHVFLTNFDYLSVYERKNPLGAIRAYIDAFSPDDGAALVVKSINGHQRPLHAEHVRSAARGRPDIHFVDGYVTGAAMKAMIELSDAYVSLHRAEGYGLNMADAMARGTPVIATAYSGNMDFMDSSTAELIDFELVPVGPNAEPYDPRAVWAQADSEAASASMRRLFEDRVGAAALAGRAAAHVQHYFSHERVGRQVAALLLPGLREHGWT